jgi:hypothetical protein
LATGLPPIPITDFLDVELGYISVVLRWLRTAELFFAPFRERIKIRSWYLMI